MRRSRCGACRSSRRSIEGRAPSARGSRRTARARRADRVEGVRAPLPGGGPARRRAPAEGRLRGEMNDIGKRRRRSRHLRKRYRDEVARLMMKNYVRRTCERCALLDMIAKARDLRLVVWELRVSSSRFADLQLNAIEHWTDFEKRPRANLRLDAAKLAREIELEEALRDARPSSNYPTRRTRRRWSRWPSTR